MNKAGKLISLSLAAVMLFGCTAKKERPKKENKKTSHVVTLSAEDRYTPKSLPLPVLSIETKSKAHNVMDFVTEPVAAHVTEIIKQWDNTFDAPAPYYEDCSITLTGSDGKVQLNGADAQVKVRGNWTTLYPKKPLKIKFSEKQDMLGLNNSSGFKNWLLLAEYKDCSMLRNKAVFMQHVRYSVLTVYMPLMPILFR